MQKCFTLSRLELARLFCAQKRQRPGLQVIDVVSVVDGWATVHLPHWAGTTIDVYGRIVATPR